MYFKITSLTLLILCVTFTSHAKQSITMVGIQDYRPYSYLENNKPEGLYNDILNELFTRLDYELHIELVPFKRMLSMVETGEATGMAGTFLKPERTTYAHFLTDCPLAGITLSLFVLKKSAIQHPTIQELEGKEVGHKRGFVMSAELDTAAQQKKFNLHSAESVTQLISMLLYERLDVFCHTTDNALSYMRRMDTKNEIRLLKPPVTTSREAYMAFSRKALTTLPKTFIADIVATFNAMEKDGTLLKLQKKHSISNPLFKKE